MNIGPIWLFAPDSSETVDTISANTISIDMICYLSIDTISTKTISVDIMLP